MNNNNKKNAPKMNTPENYKTYSMDLIKSPEEWETVELSRDVRFTLNHKNSNPVNFRGEFEAAYPILINDKYIHIDREAVAEKIIDICHLTEAQAINLMIAANCDSGVKLPPDADSDEGEVLDLIMARRELEYMKLITLYDEAMIVDWNWLAGIIGWYEAHQTEEEIKH